jgi:hypothetical protein
MSLKNYLLLPMFLMIGQLFGQVPPIIETEKLMSLGSRSAYRIEFLRAKPGYVEDCWVDFFKQELQVKPKYDKKKKEYCAADVRASFLKADVPVDFYSKAEESGTSKEDSDFILWIDLNSDEFVSKKENPDAAKEAEAMLLRFAKFVRMAQVKDQLKIEDKKLRDDEGDLKKLQREKESLEKDIDTWKKKIAKAEDELKINALAQQKKTTDIEVQTKAVQNVQAKLIEIEKSK